MVGEMPILGTLMGTGRLEWCGTSGIVSDLAVRLDISDGLISRLGLINLKEEDC